MTRNDMFMAVGIFAVTLAVAIVALVFYFYGIFWVLTKLVG